VPLGLILLFGGALFLVAGVKGVHPWDPVLKAMGGTQPPPPGAAAAATNTATYEALLNAGNAPAPSPGGAVSTQQGASAAGVGFPSSYLPPAAPAGIGPNPFGGQIVGVARGFLGAPYRMGGVTRSGIDCSGLSLVAYQSVGVKLPHLASAQLPLCRVLKPSEVSPGDLIFFFSLAFDPHDPIFHVAVYSGSNRMIEATSVRRPCSEDPITLQHFAHVYARPHAIIGLGGRRSSGGVVL
jgi:cell wall-associated NlpC family hydrolase